MGGVETMNQLFISHLHVLEAGSKVMKLAITIRLD